LIIVTLTNNHRAIASGTSVLRFFDFIFVGEIMVRRLQLAHV